MFAERLLTTVVKTMASRELVLKPYSSSVLPSPKPNTKYMLYLHVPFCEVLCPYCSFNRYPFREEIARPYFANLRKEMLMVADMGYNIESLYFGGGTPTVLLDELCATIDLARQTFSITEVGVETNPNHLVEPYLSKLQGRVQRLSVGVQSFDDTLLKQMERYHKYGSGEQIVERIACARTRFDSLNIDMIFNFPTQTQDVLERDIQTIIDCGARQVTFSPLYVSDATTKKMAQALGHLDYDRERHYYHLLDEKLTAGSHPPFARETIWTFNRLDAQGKRDHAVRIDEYMTSYDEYPAIGSGSITHLDGKLFVNSFSIKEYNDAIEAGHMSVMGASQLSARDLMRYDMLVGLYKLRLDKELFKEKHGCSIERGLPVEMAFMRANHAFDIDDAHELTLTPEGRYLTLVMYRQFLSGMNNLRDQARDALSGPERELLFEDSHT